MAKPDKQHLLIGLKPFLEAFYRFRDQGKIAIAFDLETDSLVPQDARVIWLSWCLSKECFGAIPVLHKYPTSKNEHEDEVKNIIREIHRNGDITVIWHNATYDLSVLVSRDWLDLAEIKALVFDTMIASFALNPIKNREGGNHRLKNLYNEIVREEGDPPQVDFESATGGRAVADSDFDIIAWYAAFDTWTTFQLYRHFKEKIEFDSLLSSHFYRIECPHILTTVEIKTSGMKLIPQSALPQTEPGNLPGLKSIDGLRQELQQTIFRIFELSGRTFNFSSPDALRRFLFVEGVGLNPQGRSGTSGRHLVDKVALIRAFMDPETKKSRTKQKIIANVLYAKQLTESIKKHEEMYSFVHPRTGKIYSELSPLVASGRFKAKHPNVLSLSSSSRIKHHIVPSDGNTFVVADFSQIDLRVIANEAAEMNESSKMWQDVNRGVDLHFNTLKIVDDRARSKKDWNKFGENSRGELAVFDIDSNEIPLNDDEKRLAKSLKKARGDIAKPVNFGVSYGLGATGLLGNLNVTDDMRDKIISLPSQNQSEEDWIKDLDSLLQREDLTLDQANDFLIKFHDAYPDIGKFQKRVECDLMKNGVTYNLFGRLCRAESLPHLEDAHLDVKVDDRRWYRLKIRKTRIDAKYVYCLIREIHALDVVEPNSRGILKVSDLLINVSRQIYGYKEENLRGILESWKQNSDHWKLVDNLLTLNADASWEVDDLFDYVKPSQPVDYPDGDLAAGIVDRPLFPFAKIPHRLIKRIITQEGPELTYINFDKLRRNLISSRVSSTSMDFCKIAMSTFRRRVTERWPDKAVRPKIINCIHDEIAVECRAQDSDEVVTMLRSAMEDDALYESFVVPGRRKHVYIRADIKTGKSYAKAKP